MCAINTRVEYMAVASRRSQELLVWWRHAQPIFFAEFFTCCPHVRLMDLVACKRWESLLWAMSCLKQFNCFRLTVWIGGFRSRYKSFHAHEHEQYIELSNGERWMIFFCKTTQIPLQDCRLACAVSDSHVTVTCAQSSGWTCCTSSRCLSVCSTVDWPYDCRRRWCPTARRHRPRVRRPNRDAVILNILLGVLSAVHLKTGDFPSHLLSPSYSLEVHFLRSLHPVRFFRNSVWSPGEFFNKYHPALQHLQHSGIFHFFVTVLG